MRKNLFPLVRYFVSCAEHAEPVFIDPLRSPEIDSQPGGRQPYMLYWPARQHRLAASIPRNRFLGSINIYKYGLCAHTPSVPHLFQNTKQMYLVPRTPYLIPCTSYLVPRTSHPVPSTSYFIPRTTYLVHNSRPIKGNKHYIKY